ncbi:MAG: hypothetical protein SPG37_07705, partial [Eubacteriales bacterium]|nr:hypothetical protein [Eubacteriales bacterium]
RPMRMHGAAAASGGTTGSAAPAASFKYRQSSSAAYAAVSPASGWMQTENASSAVPAIVRDWTGGSGAGSGAVYAPAGSQNPPAKREAHGGLRQTPKNTPPQGKSCGGVFAQFMCFRSGITSA